MRFGIRTLFATLLAVLAAGASGSILSGPALAKTIDPPTTTASLSPQPNAAGWNNAPVTITLTATRGTWALKGASTDLDGFYPAPRSYYRFGGGGEYEGYSVYDPAAKPVVSAEGSTVVWFYSIDLLTATPPESLTTPLQPETPKSVTVSIDTTAPTTSATVDPLPNAQGINTTPVTVTLEAQDALSGVNATYYRLGADGEYSQYSGPLTVDTEGTTDIFYYSTDKAGNAETAKSVAVVVDLTPPRPKPLSGYAAVVVRRGHRAAIVFSVRDPLSDTARTKLQITKNGRVVKTVGLGTVATNKRVKARFTCHLTSGLYRYRIVATSASGLTGRYLKGYLAVGSRPTAYIQGAAVVKRGAQASLSYLLIDPWAKSAHLRLQIMKPAKAGGKATNTVVKSIDLGWRATNVAGTATFRCNVAPGLYRWAFAARDGISIALRTTSNLVWVR